MASVKTQFANRGPLELLDNETNRGFVQSVNRAACTAIQRRRDVVLLNSDTVVFPGALREIAYVAYLDPMIGFVSPRSNNATICLLPRQTQFRSAGSAEAHRYSSMYPGTCRAIRWCQRAGLVPLYSSRDAGRFGLFDEAYGAGYNEENDLIIRANRCGFRAAMAESASCPRRWHCVCLSRNAKPSPMHTT